MESNWLKEDEKCPSCGAVTKKVRGITKQNLRKLFVPKWTWDEAIITFLLIMIFALAFLYKYETAQCRDWLKPMAEDEGARCLEVCENKCSLIKSTGGGPSLTNLTLNEFNVSISYEES